MKKKNHPLSLVSKTTIIKRGNGVCVWRGETTTTKSQNSILHDLHPIAFKLCYACDKDSKRLRLQLYEGL